MLWLISAGSPSKRIGTMPSFEGSISNPPAFDRAVILALQEEGDG
jgi:hypothetical protein